jgi:hypothetical protein
VGSGSTTDNHILVRFKLLLIGCCALLIVEHTETPRQTNGRDRNCKTSKSSANETKVGRNNRTELGAEKYSVDSHKPA